MATIETKKIRNIALLGHGSSGKTSLAEAMIFACGASDRMGKTPDGNTVCDYDDEEIARGYSINAAVANVMWDGVKVNIIDAPGYLGFVGEEMEAIRVADSGIIVVDAKSGIEVGTELAWEYATGAGIPKAFFITKCDDPDADFGKLFGELHEEFGHALCPVFIPVKFADDMAMVDLMDMKAFTYDALGRKVEIPMKDEYVQLTEEYKEAFNEAIAQTDEALLEKYFGGEEITHDEAVEALHTGFINGTIVPVYCGASPKMWGVRSLLDAINASFPRHTAKKTEKDIAG